jgi:hypothetical protein
LECYIENLPKSFGGRPALELNKFMEFVTPNQGPGIPNGEPITVQCPAGVTHCATFRCKKIGKLDSKNALYTKIIKNVALVEKW